MPLTPNDWNEVLPQDDVGPAFDLLQGTFPSRYLHYSVAVLNRKMRWSQGSSWSSLRVFTWNDAALAPHIAAFFFLRYEQGPETAYCLSVGIDNTIANTIAGVTDLHDKLLAKVRDIQRIVPVDVVNQRVITANEPAGRDEDSFADTNYSRIVRSAFFHGVAQGTVPGAPGNITQQRSAWPSSLRRWKIN